MKLETFTYLIGNVKDLEWYRIILFTFDYFSHFKAAVMDPFACGAGHQDSLWQEWPLTMPQWPLSTWTHRWTWREVWSPSTSSPPAGTGWSGGWASWPVRRGTPGGWPWSRWGSRWLMLSLISVSSGTSRRKLLSPVWQSSYCHDTWQGQDTLWPHQCQGKIYHIKWVT